MALSGWQQQIGLRPKKLEHLFHHDNVALSYCVIVCFKLLLNMHTRRPRSCFLACLLAGSLAGSLACRWISPTRQPRGLRLLQAMATNCGLWFLCSAAQQLRRPFRPTAWLQPARLAGAIRFPWMSAPSSVLLGRRAIEQKDLGVPTLFGGMRRHLFEITILTPAPLLCFGSPTNHSSW